MKKLCIDPGHGFGNRAVGSYDPGAVAGGASEADIVLAFALTIKHVFREAGIEVFLTRDDASDVTPVGQRDNKAKAAGCTHFLSLHCNAGTAGATGTETFFRDDSKWAKTVQSVAIRALGLRDRGVKNESASQHNRLAVMDFDGEACLLEIGFITNVNDRRLMQLRDSRVALATALLQAWRSIA